MFVFPPAHALPSPPALPGLAGALSRSVRRRARDGQRVWLGTRHLEGHEGHDTARDAGRHNHAIDAFHPREKQVRVQSVGGLDDDHPRVE